MIENSLPEPHAWASTSREAVAAAIEEELARLREKRPGLASRLDRAGHLLVTHLSDPRLGTIRVRVGSDRRPRFVVRSLASAGVYIVDPYDSWRCSCPDHHRRDAACKHALACWCLKRAADRREQRKGCPLCINGWIHLGEQLIDSQSGEVVEATNVTRCGRCTPVAPTCLSDEELQSWMNSVRWKYAASMPRHPHEYHLKCWGDPEIFEAVVKSIWSAGYDRLYLRRPWRSLGVGEHFVWVCTRPEPGMEAPLSQTILINRALQVQKRLV